MKHFYDKKRFNSHVGILSQILTDNSVNFLFVEKMPTSSALACFVPKINTVYLPSINPTELTEDEAQKVLGLSAHERKHVKLTAHHEFEKLNDILSESRKKNIVREVLHNLWQTIEDLRIEMNDNYAFPGDLLNIHHVNNMLFEKYNNDLVLPVANPFGYIMECMRYTILNTHPAYPNVKTLPIPFGFKPFYNKAVEIMMDGRFHNALKKGKETTHITLTLALEIEKAWEDLCSDNGINSLNKKFNEDQKNAPMGSNPLADAINEIMEDQKSEEISNSPRNRKNLKEIPIAGDRIIIDPPNQSQFEYVYGKIGSNISIVRDRIAIHLKTISENRIVKGLRRGKIDHSRFYQTALNNKNIMKKVYPGIDYSAAVQIVVDLSGSMGHRDNSSLCRYQLAMQMAIVLAEVFQLLKIPFEVTGFNTGGGNYNSMENIEFETPVNIRTETVNFHIFKAFEDDYSICDVKHRLGSISANGNNIDHEVISWSAGRLAKRKEKRKLQIILSDGQPCGHTQALKDTNNRIINGGINQFAFGLMSDCVEEYYKKFVVIENMNELNSKALEIFVDFLMEGAQ